MFHSIERVVILNEWFLLFRILLAFFNLFHLISFSTINSLVVFYFEIFSNCNCSPWMLISMDTLWSFRKFLLALLYFQKRQPCIYGISNVSNHIVIHRISSNIRISSFGVHILNEWVASESFNCHSYHICYIRVIFNNYFYLTFCDSNGLEKKEKRGLRISQCQIGARIRNSSALPPAANSIHQRNEHSSHMDSTFGIAVILIQGK